MVIVTFPTRFYPNLKVASTLMHYVQIQITFHNALCANRIRLQSFLKGRHLTRLVRSTVGYSKQTPRPCRY